MARPAVPTSRQKGRPAVALELGAYTACLNLRAAAEQVPAAATGRA